MTSPQRLALFDFDGTLCADNTLHLFMRHLLANRRGVPGLIGWSVRRKLRLANSRSFKEGILGLVAGLSEPELDALGGEIYTARVRPRLRKEGLLELAEMQRQGYRVMLVTGAFDFLVAPFCAEFGLGETLCCRVERKHGKCTGRIQGAEMIGGEKVLAIRAALPGAEVDWPQSRAYTDDPSDRPMLALVGTRFHVRGTAAAIPATKTLDWNATIGH